MNIDIIGILSVLSPIAGFIIGLLTMRRWQKTDDASSGREMGALLTDIGYIKSSTDEIKRKFDTHDERFMTHAERISANEQSVKKAHDRIDILAQKVLNCGACCSTPPKVDKI